MPRVLHIIATCTDRKRNPAPKQLCLRSVRHKDIRKRAEIWCDRLEKYRGTKSQAKDLYLGEHWRAVLNLQKLAETAGFSSNLWILSAGYGLLPSIAHIHPYSATFASSQPDSIANGQNLNLSKREALQAWWNDISGWNPGVKTPRTLRSLIKDYSNDYYLLLASPDYLLAIEQDLLAGFSSIEKQERLCIISSKDHNLPKVFFQNLVISNARLQSRLGGTRASLHPRVAALLLAGAKSWGFDPKRFKKHIASLVSRSPELRKYSRLRMSDDQVREFIRHKLNQSLTLSCTVLLRQLRNNGHACEQARFKGLYWQVKEGRL